MSGDPEIQTVSRECGTATLRLREGTRDHEVMDEVWGPTDTYRYSPDQVGFSGVVVDIGAHVGCFSILAAVCGASRVIAVEPDPDNVAALRENLALNEAGHRVTVEQAGVWYKAAQGEHQAGDGPDSVTGEGLGGVTLMTLDDLWERHAIRSCDLLKVDAEGAEPEIIAGASDELLWSIRRIVMELHGPEMLAGRREVSEDAQAKMIHRLSDSHRLEIIQRTETGGMLTGMRH